MDHAGDDVFAGTALALNQDRDIGACHLVHAVSKQLHDFRVAENYGLGRKLSQRSSQRSDGWCSCHEYLVAYGPLVQTLGVHPESQTVDPLFGRVEMTLKALLFSIL